MGKLDAAVRDAALDRLGALVDQGKITVYEYNLRKKALDEGRADAAEAPLEALGAAAPPASVKRSSSWDAAAPKRWTSPEGRGDDPTVRVVHPPAKPGIGDGKAFLFLWGLKRTRDVDQQLLAREQAAIEDDIAVLRDAGYTVVVDPQATKEEFLQALYGEADGAKGLAPVGLVWSAHGHPDGAIETCDGGFIRPEDVETAKVSPALKLLIFSACYTGARSATWRRAAGGKPMVVGWGRPVTFDRAVDFLTPDPESETDLDDLIARYLLRDTPLPADGAGSFALVPPATGRIDDLQKRVEAVAELLGARWRERDGKLELNVPLPGRRHQEVEALVVDSGAPYNEGEPLLMVRTEVGELSGVVALADLLAAGGAPGYARVALVKGPAEQPLIVVQGFLPLSRVRDRDLAALVQEVAVTGDALEARIFGGDMH
jgi:hypothetical protein